MEQILIIDQGTHASRCMIFDITGKLLATSQHPVTIYRQGHEIIEQNAEEILASIYYCIDHLQHQHDFIHIKSAALVTQRSTIVGWHKQTGKVLSPAISWQDTRAAERIRQMQTQSDEIKSITGLPLSAHYGASKIEWLIRHDENCAEAYKEKILVIAPLASYLVEQLTGITEPVIDHVNAQRSQLLDLNSLDWSKPMLNKFGLQLHCLPKVKPCMSDYGLFRHHNIPLKLVTGDQNAAVFANGQPKEDSLLVNIGTGAFVLKLTKSRCNDPAMLDGLALSSEDSRLYLQEGTVNGAGSALALLFNEIDQSELFDSLPAWLNTVQSPPVFINSVSGLGSPWWNNTIEPHYLNTEADKLELPDRAVAIIESIIFLLQINIEHLRTKQTHQIIISGGLARLDGLCQKLADLSQLEVKRTDNLEASATGAAWLLCHHQPDHDNWQYQQDVIAFSGQQNIGLHNRYQQFKKQLQLLCEQNHRSATHAIN